MLPCQKDLFQLPDDIFYFNCAYMSPLLKSVEEAGIKGMARKRNPSGLRSEDFFNEAEETKIKAARLIKAASQQIALIPSASYGLRSVINNLPVNKGRHAITVGDEFPSGYYTILNWCKKNNKDLKVIPSPAIQEGRGKKWNEQILESINTETSV